MHRAELSGAPSEGEMQVSEQEQRKYIDRFSLFAIMFAAYILFAAIPHLTTSGPLTTEKLGWLSTAGCAVLLLLSPRSSLMLIVTAALFIFRYLLILPVASNNQMMALFCCLSILAAGAFVWWQTGRTPAQASFDKEKLYDAFAPSARLLLIIMYFYGIYHKINTGFLDPNVSCAVELYSRVTAPFGLSEWSFGHYASIYTTFIAEGLAICFLFSKRYKWWGFVFGLPFHIAIGFSGYAYYLDFCTIVYAHYALFFSDQAYARFNRDIEKVRVRLGIKVERWTYWTKSAAIASLLVVFTVTALAYSTGVAQPYTPYPVWIVFAPYSMALLVGSLYYMWPQGDPERTQPKSHFRFVSNWMILLPAAFFINGMSPYFGWKTESSIAMFSNLHTEGGVSNHLLHPTPPYIFGFQSNDKLIEVVSVENTGEGPEYSALNALVGRNEGQFIVELSFFRLLSENPHQSVTYRYRDTDTLITSSDAEIMTYRSMPIWVRRFADFKPVDFNRPKVCTH